jgi:hypothetical protein
MIIPERARYFSTGDDIDFWRIAQMETKVDERVEQSFTFHRFIFLMHPPTYFSGTAGSRLHLYQKVCTARSIRHKNVDIGHTNWGQGRNISTP